MRPRVPHRRLLLTLLGYGAGSGQGREWPAPLGSGSLHSGQSEPEASPRGHPVSLPPCCCFHNQDGVGRHGWSHSCLHCTNVRALTKADSLFFTRNGLFRNQSQARQLEPRRVSFPWLPALHPHAMSIEAFSVELSGPAPWGSVLWPFADLSVPGYCAGRSLPPLTMGLGRVVGTSVTCCLLYHLTWPCGRGSCLSSACGHGPGCPVSCTLRTAAVPFLLRPQPALCLVPGL